MVRTPCTYRAILAALATTVALSLSTSGASGGTITSGSRDYHRFVPSGWTSGPSRKPSNARTLSTNRKTQTTANKALRASLSGSVWFDENADGLFIANLKDSAIHGALLLLYNMKDLKRPIATTYTNQKGVYEFGGLLAGKYALALRYPSSPGGVNSLGQVITPAGTPAPTGNGLSLAAKDMFIDITLAAGSKGRNYTFGELTCPVSKREFINTPEPSAVVLLASGATLGIVTWVCRRRRRSRFGRTARQR